MKICWSNIAELAIYIKLVFFMFTYKF